MEEFCRKHDEEMVRGLDDDINTLLVFVRCFFSGLHARSSHAIGGFILSSAECLCGAVISTTAAGQPATVRTTPHQARLRATTERISATSYTARAIRNANIRSLAQLLLVRQPRDESRRCSVRDDGEAVDSRVFQMVDRVLVFRGHDHISPVPL